MKRVLLFLVVFFFAVGLHAQQPRFTPTQSWVIIQAGRSALSYEDLSTKTQDFTLYFQSIIYQESSFCRLKVGLDKTSYGCGQIQITTAEQMGYTVSLMVLQMNVVLNLNIAATYLAYCIKQEKTWDRGITCYNSGPVAARSAPNWWIYRKDSYIRAIWKRKKELTAIQDTD